MGTLELRITAVKPGVDGKLVSVNYSYSHFKKNRQNRLVQTLIFAVSWVIVGAQIRAALLQ